MLIFSKVIHSESIFESIFHISPKAAFNKPHREDQNGDTMNGIYRFADKSILIESVYPYVHSYCAGYSTQAAPDLTAAVTREDIEFERSRSEDTPASDEYLESLAVYRKIAEMMPLYDTVLFHGSAIAVKHGDEQPACFIFTAKSGTGKSTHTALWRKAFGDSVFMVNDDKPLLKIGEDSVTVYGTPYDGKHRLSSPTAVPLKGLCILCRGRDNRIERIDRRTAYPVLFTQMYRPFGRDAAARSLVLLDKLMEQIPLYRLYANMDIEAAYTAYNAMNT